MGDPSITALQDPTLMRAQQRVGRVLRGKWHLDRLLGVGGMAAVYGATHRNGKRGAIKMLHVELSLDVQIRERFLREGRAANHVGHPGAVSVLDDDVAEDGAIFLVMDLLEGESLEGRRERVGGKMDVVDVISIVDQVLDVLAAAHEKGIVHRDLKPDNLFVTRDGAVKVLDFGIARLREGSTGSATQTGVSMGTPSFMPQEQARALWNEVDARTDLWAVGATMFACLTGRVVHDGRTMNEMLLSAMTKTAPPIRSLMPTLPRAVAEVIDRSLAFERDQRFANATEMQGALRRAYEAMQSAPISTAPKLVVPDVAMQRTVPSAGVLAADAPPQRTGEPVAAGQTGVPVRAPSSARNLVIAVAASGLLVAGAASTGTLLLLKTPAGPSEVPGSAPVTASAPATSASAPVASAAPSEVAVAPKVSLDDLPAAKPERKMATTPAVAAPKAAPPPNADPFDRRGK